MLSLVVARGVVAPGRPGSSLPAVAARLLAYAGQRPVVVAAGHYSPLGVGVGQQPAQRRQVGLGHPGDAGGICPVLTQHGFGLVQLGHQRGAVAFSGKQARNGGSYAQHAQAGRVAVGRVAAGWGARSG